MYSGQCQCQWTGVSIQNLSADNLCTDSNIEQVVFSLVINPAKFLRCFKHPYCHWFFKVFFSYNPSVRWPADLHYFLQNSDLSFTVNSDVNLQNCISYILLAKEKEKSNTTYALFLLNSKNLVTLREALF